VRGLVCICQLTLFLYSMAGHGRVIRDKLFFESYYLHS
jgi:hypothetical protein